MAGEVSSWQTGRNRGGGVDVRERQFGFVRHEGGAEYWFKRSAVLPPCPEVIRKGMAVEFTASLNPNRGNNANKPIALDVAFVDGSSAAPLASSTSSSSAPSSVTAVGDERGAAGA